MSEQEWPSEQMTHARPPGAVVVCADRSAAGHRALRWAVAEARREEAPLYVVPAGAPQRQDQSLLADAMAAVRDSVAHVPVFGGHARGAVPDTLRELSVDARLVVVPATLPELTRVVADSYCPVASVPEHRGEAVAERGPVVLGAAPWTGTEVIDLAYREAADRRADLLAVRAWSDPLLDLMSTRSEDLADWDRATSRESEDLELELSPWAVIHPDVRTERMVVQDRPSAFLLALSYRAQLLVLGRSTRGALLGLIADSPADALLRSARCPVLVVPASGPPRRTWLPADTARRSRSR
jgi:nucleotide-binding universal stress UspA family protein